ncbi:purine-nucleoside phosphorylase [Haloferula sargassicola]
MVLGSGLGSIVDRMEIGERVPFSEAGIPTAGVAGHQGAFLLGRLAGRPVIAMAGRVHLYEGHDAKTVTAGVRWMAKKGVGTLVLTNAAGSLREDQPPGSWMVISDHLNLTGTSPLEGGPNFVDMSAVYDLAIGERLRAIAAGHGWHMGAGVYAGLRGPQYETPAEIRMLRTMGADAVGMSTVLEAMEAKRIGLKVVGLSCLTNYAAGMPSATLDHGDVMATGRNAADKMIRVFREWMES